MKHCVVVCTLALLVGCSPTLQDDRPVVAATTSYLECAIKDLAGEQFRVARLLPPGCCPGHFDVSPAVLDHLANAALLLRFEFQGGLDAKLKHFQEKGLNIVAVASPEGLCVPSTYVIVCRTVCRALCEACPDSAASYREKLASVERRMTALGEDMKAQVRKNGLAGTRVISSGHQAHFCRALGLEVVAPFTGREAAALKELERCLEAGRSAKVRFVVANLQEGAQLADPLAQKLGARVVAFSNFPSMAGEQTTFDALVRDNVAALLTAAKKANK